MSLCNKLLLTIVIHTIFAVSFLLAFKDDDITSRGYIIYCPCMGRFGNQAEQLLGSLLFAKSLNRTLVLPPFIHYNNNQEPVLIPFESIIKVEPITDYHEVILMTDFMRYYSGRVWPPGDRRFFCYTSRNSGDGNYTCDALKGQPFNTFWTSFDISEDKSEFFKPMSTNPSRASYWSQKYPISSHRVLTFAGAPSPFPTHEESIHIQKYLKFSEELELDALNARKLSNFMGRPYLSMHIRHGIDWKRACDIIKTNAGLTQLFSSSQCTGYQPTKSLDYNTCFPSFETIVKKLQDSLETHKLKYDVDIKFVHIATDYDDLNLRQNLETEFPGVKFVMAPKELGALRSMMIDINWMTYADVFIGNCVSSFSAFAARMRTEQLFLKDSTHYFGYDNTPRDTNYTVHEEL